LQTKKREQEVKTVTEKQKYQAEQIAKTIKDVTDYQKTVISAFTEGLCKGIEIANQTKKVDKAEKPEEKTEKKEGK
jgi:hypothetical protein